MNRLFIDTNVLVSAIVFDKNELKQIKKGLEEDDLFISEHILEETTRVIIKKFPTYFYLFEKFIELSNIKIIDKEIYIESINEFDDIRDKYDAHVVACAEKMDCNFIISGDKDLLQYEGTEIQVLRAPEYLEK
ncbi:MAG: putative toxin-antitoxin system toxin component, PIN family [Candidatus Saliniplasma sp.]